MEGAAESEPWSRPLTGCVGIAGIRVHSLTDGRPFASLPDALAPANVRGDIGPTRIASDGGDSRLLDDKVGGRWTMLFDCDGFRWGLSATMVEAPTFDPEPAERNMFVHVLSLPSEAFAELDSFVDVVLLDETSNHSRDDGSRTGGQPSGTATASWIDSRYGKYDVVGAGAVLGADQGEGTLRLWFDGDDGLVPMDFEHTAHSREYTAETVGVLYENLPRKATNVVLDSWFDLDGQLVLKR